jgi:retron-type reverse transcriptase
MTKTREKSDRCVVPEKDGNASGGKAATVSEQAEQLGLSFDVADSPKGDNLQTDMDESLSVRKKSPESKNKANMNLPAITMEEISSRENLKRAIKQVISNKGSAGPDGMDVSELKERQGEISSLLHMKLLDGTYIPGLVKRVWIPKGNGGQRGLGVPDVMDRVVQQAVLQVMSPHYEPEFHPSSHGFRKGRGCQSAIAEAISHIEEGYDWVVDIDLEKFLDHTS